MVAKGMEPRWRTCQRWKTCQEPLLTQQRRISGLDAWENRNEQASGRICNARTSGMRARAACMRCFASQFVYIQNAAGLPGGSLRSSLQPGDGTPTTLLPSRQNASGLSGRIDTFFVRVAWSVRLRRTRSVAGHRHLLAAGKRWVARKVNPLPKRIGGICAVEERWLESLEREPSAERVGGIVPSAGSWWVLPCVLATGLGIFEPIG